MLTNIVATLTIFTVTNVSEIVPQKMVADPVPPGPNGEMFDIFKGHYEPIKDPCEKWVKTEIVEVHSLTHDFDGYPCKDEYSIIKTNWTVHFDKTEGWQESKTNTPLPQSWLGYWHP